MRIGNELHPLLEVLPGRRRRASATLPWAREEIDLVYLSMHPSNHLSSLSLSYRFDIIPMIHIYLITDMFSVLAGKPSLGRGKTKKGERNPTMGERSLIQKERKKERQSESLAQAA